MGKVLSREFFLLKQMTRALIHAKQTVCAGYLAGWEAVGPSP